MQGTSRWLGATEASGRPITATWQWPAAGKARRERRPEHGSGTAADVLVGPDALGRQRLGNTHGGDAATTAHTGFCLSANLSVSGYLSKADTGVHAAADHACRTQVPAATPAQLHQ